MALAKDMMGLGVPPGMGSILGGQTKTGISAAGTVITDATDLTFSKNVVETVTSGAGVQLMPMTPGESQIVYNATVTELKVYPGTSSMTINQVTAGAAVTLPGMTVCEFHQATSTKILGNLSA